MANRKRNSEGKFASKGMTSPIRDNPWTSAAIAAGAAGLGAFLWSKRNQLGETWSSGIDRLSELKSERMADLRSGQKFDGTAGTTLEPFMAKPAKRSARKSQKEIAEEALTLKETGDPVLTGI